MRWLYPLGCAAFGCVAWLALAGEAEAQRSLFDQTPIDPSAGFAPPAAVAPAPAPLTPPPSAAPVQNQAAPAPARATQAPEPTAAEPAPAGRRAKPRPKTAAKPAAYAKPNEPRPAGSITLINGSTATITSVTIAAGEASVAYRKALAPNARAVVKLPKTTSCSVTITPTFGSEAGTAGEVDTCKDKIVKLTD